MSGLRFSSQVFERFREHLLQDGDIETCSIAYAHRNSRAGSWVVAETAPVPDDAYLGRDNVSAVLKPAFLVEVANKARAGRYSIVLAHTHPFASGIPSFSDVDDAGELEVKAFLDRRAPGGDHLALVVGRDGCRARQLGRADTVPVWKVGETVGLLSGVSEGTDDDSPHERQIRAFGAQGQRVVSTLRVAVVGAGGTGSVTLQQLAHLGVCELTIIDPDVVEKTNLNRLVGARPSDVGTPKVDVARRLVSAVNPTARVEALQRDVVDAGVADLLTGFDFVFLCTDSHASRAVVGQLAYQHLVPTIDMGVSISVGPNGVEHVSGRVQLLSPGTTCLTCTRALDGEQIRREMLSPHQRAADPYVQGIHEPQPAVISLNSTVASLAVTMFLGVVTPVPSRARFQLYDGVKGTVRPTASPALSTCIVCSSHGALARGVSWPLPGRQKGQL